MITLCGTIAFSMGALLLTAYEDTSFTAYALTTVGLIETVIGMSFELGLF